MSHQGENEPACPLSSRSTLAGKRLDMSRDYSRAGSLSWGYKIGMKWIPEAGKRDLEEMAPELVLQHYFFGVSILYCRLGGEGEGVHFLCDPLDK